MTGICDTCGARRRVPSTRGSLLADFRCLECGGTLHGAAAGRAMVRCVLCGRPVRQFSWRIRQAQTFYAGRIYMLRNYPTDQWMTVCPGDWVCWRHQLGADLFQEEFPQ